MSMQVFPDPMSALADSVLTLLPMLGHSVGLQRVEIASIIGGRKS
jgi:hypothetical protein